MAYVFRKINNKARWYRKEEEDVWLNAGELPADPLGGLKTSSNTLSVYYINNLEQELKRVVAAIASANTDRPRDVHYILIDLDKFESLGLDIVVTPGETPDKTVNKWHRDITQLSAYRLIDLAVLFWNEGTKERIRKKVVVRLLHEGIELENIDTSKLKSTMKKNLGIPLD